MRIALAGNPNCGKTTLFNLFTGSRQAVGNWPGVTVEKKTGVITSSKDRLEDLPGIYSLSSCSLEEQIARDALLDAPPDLILNLVDGANLERSLYLTLQLMELGRPMVLAVNMMDELKKSGRRLNVSALSRLLGVPVVPVCARTGEGVEALLLALSRQRTAAPPRPPQYDPDTRQAVERIIRLCEKTGSRLPMPFVAAKLLEQDENLLSRPELAGIDRAELTKIQRDYQLQARQTAAGTFPLFAAVANARYNLIQQVAAESIAVLPGNQKPALTSRLDRIATGRITALPCFFLLMGAVFWLTFGPVGRLCKQGVESFFSGPFQAGALTLMERIHAPGWFQSLIAQALVGGLGSVLSFLPQIVLLFGCLTFLENSGYMARAAFVMDRPMRSLGLSGKSFIPMLMGFGCTTPAVMAARTLEREKDRRMTILLTPFLSCGARLPVYGLFAGIFFPQRTVWIVLSLYGLGILIAALWGLILRRTVFRGKEAPFLLELPPYRLPTVRGLFRQVWEKTRGFLWKAGTVILAMSIFVWFFENFSWNLQPAASPETSMLAAFGKWIAPIFAPLGFGFWQAAVALLAGLVAKESVVSTLAMLYGGHQLSLALATAFTPLSAYAFLVFTLLYIPCISALAAIRQEMKSLRWTVFSVLLSFGTAYLAAFLFYQAGLWLG